MVHEERGALDPLAVEPPGGLCPARVRDHPDEVLVRDAVPQRRGTEMAQGIGPDVEHHLGILGGARGEVDEERVF